MQKDLELPKQFGKRRLKLDTYTDFKTNCKDKVIKTVWY